jgi:hypothetical protein
LTFDGKVAHLWPDQCEGEDPLRAGGQGGRAGRAGGRVAGAASAATAAAAAAQVRSAAQRAARLRSKSSRMLSHHLVGSQRCSSARLVEHVESRVIGVNMAQRRDASTARKCRTRVCGASRRGRIKLKDSSGFHTDILAQSIARQVCAQFAVAWRGLCRRTSRRGSAADSHWLSSRRSARRIGSVGATSTALGLAQRGGREHRQAANAHLGRT